MAVEARSIGGAEGLSFARSRRDVTSTSRFLQQRDASIAGVRAP